MPTPPRPVAPRPIARAPFRPRVIEEITPPGSPLILPGMLSCRDCTLAEHRMRVVPGWGQWPAKVMFVAQSPGEEEDRRGIPLIGKTGKLFTQILTEVGIDLGEQYKTNVNHCHPEGNRKATPGEVHACRRWLDQEVNLVDPEIIVAMGDSAYKVFLPDETKSSITQIQGSVFQRVIAGKMRYVIPTVHPSYVSRNLAVNRPIFKSHMQKVKDLLDGKPVTEALPFRKIEATWDEILEVVYDPDHRPFGFDLETDSTDHNADVIGVGVCNTPGDGRYYPFMNSEEAAELLPQLREALESTERIKIVSNAKFERHILRGCKFCADGQHASARYGITLRNYYDTLLAAWLVGTVPLGLKDAMHALFGIEMLRIDRFKEMGFKKKDRFGNYQVDMVAAQSEVLNQVIEYAAQDPDASLRVHLALEPILKERGQWELYTELELPISEVIVEMEHNGMLFDPTPLDRAAPDLLVQMGLQVQKLNELVGTKFNPVSTDQCAEILYGQKYSHPYKLPIPDDFDSTKTKTGLPSTDRITLGQHLDNPVARGILSARAQRKLYGTYVKGLLKWPEEDGRIRSDLKQTGAGTGRPSSKDPNMQNIPARTRDDVDMGIDIHVCREAFIASPGNFIYAPDLSQIEMRLAADRSGDESMIHLITTGADLHNNSAYKMYKVTAEHIASGQITPEDWKNMRYLAKTIGFGCLFGLTESGLLLRTPTLDLTLEDARGFINGFYDAYPGLRQWQRDTIDFVREHGYGLSILNRRRYFPDIRANQPKYRSAAEREAINFPIQGSAADYFKICLLRVMDFLNRANLKTKLIMQVHDEIVMEGPQEELDILEANIPELMATAIPLRVPVKVDFEWGTDWGHLHGHEVA